MVLFLERLQVAGRVFEKKNEFYHKTDVLIKLDGLRSDRKWRMEKQGERKSGGSDGIKKKSAAGKAKEYEYSLHILSGFAASVADTVMMVTPEGRIVAQFGDYKRYFPKIGMEGASNLSDILSGYLYKQFMVAIETLCKTDEKFEFETESFVEEQKCILQIEMSLVLEKDIISIKVVDITSKCVTERKVELVYEYQKRSRFFNSILTGGYNQDQQRKLLSVYGIESQKSLVCYMVSTANPNKKNQNLNLGVGEWLIEKGYGWIWNSNFGIGVLMQYPNYDNEIRQIALMLKESMEMRFPDVQIHLGIAYSNVESGDFKQLYYDALAALMRAIDEDKPYILADKNKNGLYEMVAHSFEHMDVERFIEQVLGKLKQNDAKNGGELLETLEQLLHVPSIKAVAANLFIHHNTVLWRKQKIEELLDVSLDDVNVRTQINLALKIIKIKNFIKNNDIFSDEKG